MLFLREQDASNGTCKYGDKCKFSHEHRVSDNARYVIELAEPVEATIYLNDKYWLDQPITDSALTTKSQECDESENCNIDSGSSSHFVPNTPFFAECIVPGSATDMKCKVTIADGKYLTGSKAANFIIKSNIENAKNDNNFLMLKHARMIDGLDVPLISVSKLCDDDITILFKKNYCYINRGSKKILENDRKQQRNKNLYHVDNSLFMKYTSFKKLKINNESAYLASTHKGNDIVSTLHNACMHVNYKTLSHIYELMYGKMMPRELPFCDACAAAKAHAQPLPKVARRKAIRINQHISIDWIVFGAADRYNNRYLLHIRCKYSQKSWGYPSPTRANITEWTIRFIKMAERQHPDKKIVYAHYDGELATTEFENFISKNGIQPNKTAPYTSEQNPVERHHRTIEEAGKAMLHQSGLNNSWLITACLYAIFIYNHLPIHKTVRSK